MNFKHDTCAEYFIWWLKTFIIVWLCNFFMHIYTYNESIIINLNTIKWDLFFLIFGGIFIAITFKCIDYLNS